MKLATLITTDVNGKLYAANIEPSEFKELNIPEPLVGPFRFDFSMEDANGPKDFTSTILINKDSFAIRMEEFPVIAQWEKILYPWGINEIMTEGKDEPHEVSLMNIKRLYNKDSIILVWIKNKNPMVFLEKEGKTYSIIFHNFYEDTNICLGSINAEGGGLEIMMALLGSSFTPHATFSKSIYFRRKDGYIIESEGKVVKTQELDLPEVKQIIQILRQKPLATLIPS